MTNRRRPGIHHQHGRWWTHSVCRHCIRGECHCAFGVDPEWCCQCGGAEQWLSPHLPPGGTRRLARMLADALARPITPTQETP